MKKSTRPHVGARTTRVHEEQMNIHYMAVSLHEGAVIHYQGHFLRAVKYEGDSWPCVDCQMDSICDNAIEELCTACDDYAGCQHLLKLAYL